MIQEKQQSSQKFNKENRERNSKEAASWYHSQLWQIRSSAHVLDCSTQEQSRSWDILESIPFAAYRPISTGPKLHCHKQL